MSNTKRYLAYTVAAVIASNIIASVIGKFTPVNTSVYQLEQAYGLKLSDNEKLFRLLDNLSDIISKGEGNYNSVNRGRAGDTPGGITGLYNKEFSQFTIGEIIDMGYRGEIYAVGRYQFIPKTFRYIVKVTKTDPSTKFTNKVQDKLFAQLLLHKRPSVPNYVKGLHNNVDLALDDLAKEWASIEHRNGRGYHDNVGGNRAHIKRSDVRDALMKMRDYYQSMS